MEEPGDPLGEPQPLLRCRLTPAQWLAVDAGAAVTAFVVGGRSGSTFRRLPDLPGRGRAA